MKIASGILGLAIACVAVPAMAKPAYIASTVNLRAAPGTGSEIVAKIPGGSLVDTGGCDEGWCEVIWQDKKGFAIQTSLDLSGRVPTRRAGPPRSASVVERGPPVYYEGGEAPPPAYYYYGYGPSYYRPYYYGGYGYRRWHRW